MKVLRPCSGTPFGSAVSNDSEAAVLFYLYASIRMYGVSGLDALVRVISTTAMSRSFLRNRLELTRQQNQHDIDS
jgi:hypothetical protein